MKSICLSKVQKLLVDLTKRGGERLVILILFLIPFHGFSQPQAPPTFQGTIVPIPNQSIQATLDQQLQTDSSNYRLFTINLEAMKDYFQSEDTTYLFTMRLTDVWKWTFDMIDYRPNSNLPDFLMKNRTVTTASGRSIFSLVNETILGSIQSNGHKYRFLPATDLLGSAWAGHFLVYKDPFYTYTAPVVHTTGHADIEIGFEADYDLYQYYGGNADALSEITTRIAYILEDVQVFYENKVNVLFIMKAVVARTAPDNYYGSSTNVLSNLREAWNTIYSCVPVDAAILFAGNLPHDGYSDFKANGEVFCEDVKYLPAAYVDVTGNGLSPTNANGIGHTSLTLAHEIGHLITQRGHTESTDCPNHIIAACGGSNNVPIMCNETAAQGLSFVFLPQCDIDRINMKTIEEDAVCLTGWTEAPELPCSNCSFLINIEPDNRSPMNDCGDRNEITYNIEVCNYCDDQDFVLVFNSPHEAQTILEIDPFFLYTDSDPSLDHYATQSFPMIEGECKQFAFKAEIKETFTGTVFTPGLDILLPPNTTPAYGTSITMINNPTLGALNVSGGTSLNPKLFSSYFQNPTNPQIIGFLPSASCFVVPGSSTGNHARKVISISGVLEMDLDHFGFPDQQYCLYNDVLKMNPGAQIVIKNGTLNISNSIIFGCESLWNSIIVEPGATLILENTFIEDGEYAIRAKPGAHVEIKNCTFRDNYIAFFVTDDGGAIPQNIDLVQFYGNVIETQDALKAPKAGQKAYAGMLLNNSTGIVVGNETQNRNEFRNLYNGIIAKKSNLAISNSSFYDIGVLPNRDHAIYAEARPLGLRSISVKGFGKDGDPAFSNCVSGVYLRSMYAVVTDCNMEDVHFGLRSNRGYNCKINFSNNRIASNGIAAIGLYSNTPANIRVENNAIFTNYANAAGIVVAENPVAFANHAYNHIGNNTINLKHGRAGILSYSGRYFEFYQNTINLELDDKQSAIHIEGMADGLVRCNKVFGMGGTILNSRGITAKGAFSSIFSCNHLKFTKIGMSFDGMGDQSIVRGNEFTGQAVGLQMEMNGHIGKQNHQGNLWCGSFGEFGAKHLGTSALAVEQSEFKVDATALTGQSCIYLPTWEALGVWFVPEIIQDEDIFKCSTSNACATSSPPVNIKDGISELEEKLARGSFNSSQFSSELTWAGRRHLYSRIAENSIPLQNHAYVNSFYTNAANSVIEQLHEAGQSIKEALTLSSTDETTLENYTTDIEGYLADLRQNGEALSIATTSTSISSLLADRANLLSDLGETTEDADAFSSDLYDDLISSLGAAKTVNSSVSATAVYELNEKDYNNLFLTSIEQDTLTTSQKNALWSIANQCPLEGGDGVYRARSLYALVDPLATYNDLTLCSGTQPFVAFPSFVETVPAFELYPNPASNFIMLRPLGLDEEAQIIVTIYNPLGHEILRATSTGNAEFILDTHTIASGIIWIKLSANGEPIGTRIVAITK